MTGLGALSFTTPWILFGLAILPVLWLILRATPPAPRQVWFPAFLILRKLKTQEETPERTPWWLLLLRLFLAACVIIGLAGPVLNAPKPGMNNGPMILVVDDSWAAAPGWRLRRNAMQRATNEATQADRNVYILTTTPKAEIDTLRPMTGDEARRIIQSMTPRPFTTDLLGAQEALNALGNILESSSASAEVRWLTDGLTSDGDIDFARALAALGDLTILRDRSSPQFILRQGPAGESGAAFRVERLRKGSAWEGVAVATARDGRELARVDISFQADDQSADVVIELPLALRNELAKVQIENFPSTGVVFLADARDRRALIGLVAGGDGNGDVLLNGEHYIRKALAPSASFLTGTLDTLLASDASVIILDDVGRLRQQDVEELGAWVESGGVLIRFSGPNIAGAAQEGEVQLAPAPLLGGGRALGGALTWDTPQHLGAFAPDGPFATLTPPDDVVVRQQVLARPGGDTSLATWAILEDGTPLVTGAKRGKGAITLFHITATPQWSDLPLSSIFFEMLRKLTYLSELGPETALDEINARYAPLRMLDGYGRSSSPSDEQIGVTIPEAAKGASIDYPPGLYGAPEAPIAVNAVTRETVFSPLTIPGIQTSPYVDSSPVDLSVGIFLAALLLLMIDGLVALFISGRMRFAAVMLAVAVIAPIHETRAQPYDAPVDPKAVEAALDTRLAYVVTGDPEIDRLSSSGLAALSLQLHRRTTIEPATPAAIDLQNDDLSVYTLLYWPIAPGASGLTETALVNVENFMRFGGLIIFDTRDDERAVVGSETNEGAALREILNQLDIPPLTPLPDDHVLTRSFFLIDDLPGRTQSNPVWVAAQSGGENDGVTPLIIGGRDWAGAWAADDFGRPLRPMGRGGERAREIAYRAGINMAMVAFTGNYKSDQVHTPILLERLGR